jgi:hypothetical protein
MMVFTAKNSFQCCPPRLALKVMAALSIALKEYSIEYFYLG